MNADESTEIQVSRWARFTKPALVLYVLTLVSVTGAYIWVSTMNIQVSAYLTGPSVFEHGKPNAVRGFVLDAPTGRMYRDAETTFSLQKDGQNVAVLGSETSASHGYVHSLLTVDTDAEPHDLVVDIKHAAFDEPFRAIAPGVRVSDTRPFRWPDFTSRLPVDKADWRDNIDDAWQGELRVDAFPAEGELVRGLPNTVWLRLTEKVTAEPVHGVIIFDKVEGISEIPIRKEYPTDVMGWAAVDVRPVGSHRWTVTGRTQVGDEENFKAGTGKLSFATVPAQFSLLIPEAGVVPGEPINGMIHTLYRSGGFMADLYDPNHWIGADAFGISAKGGGLQLPTPTKYMPDVYRVQVYESVFQPDNAWDTRYIARYDRQGAEGCRGALERVLNLLSEHDPDRWRGYKLSVDTEKKLGPGVTLRECNRWLTASLSAIPAHFEPPTMLVNSQQDDRKELQEWKDRTKSKLLAAIVLALLLGLFNIVVFVLSAAAESTRRQALMDAEMADFDDAPVVDTRLDRVAQAMRIIIIIGTLVFFAIGIVLVLSLL